MVCVLSLVVLWLEYTELPLRHVMGRPAPLPCAWLLLLLSLSLAVAYRASMVRARGLVLAGGWSHVIYSRPLRRRVCVCAMMTHTRYMYF